MNQRVTQIYPLADLSLTKKRDGIKKLERGIEALENFDVYIVQTGHDPQVVSLSQKISKVITDIFGNDTHEYRQYHACSTLAVMDFSINPNRISNIEGLKNNIAHAVATLQTIKEGFEEDLVDSYTSTKKITSFNDLELHPEMANVARELYHNGHYAEAIEKSVKCLCTLVRNKSGLTCDGVDLINTVFSPKNPLLQFNTLQDESDKDEHRGFMEWFRGTVFALRNPRAHKITQDDPEMALEFISFVSLLAKLLDKCISNVDSSSLQNNMVF